MIDIDEMMEKIDSMQDEENPEMVKVFLKDRKYAKAFIYAVFYAKNNIPIYISEMKDKCNMTVYESLKFFNLMQSYGMIHGVRPDGSKRVLYYTGDTERLIKYLAFAYQTIDVKDGKSLGKDGSNG